MASTATFTPKERAELVKAGSFLYAASNYGLGEAVLHLAGLSHSKVDDLATQAIKNGVNVPDPLNASVSILFQLRLERKMKRIEGDEALEVIASEAEYRLHPPAVASGLAAPHTRFVTAPSHPKSLDDIELAGFLRISTLRKRLDEKIEPLVKALNFFGMLTEESCEGHLNHRFSRNRKPWVSFETVQTAQTYRRLESSVSRFNEKSNVRWGLYPNVDGGMSLGIDGGPPRSMPTRCRRVRRRMIWRNAVFGRLGSSRASPPSPS